MIKMEDLSPLLFEDSPSSSPCLPGSKAAAGGAFEVFGKSAEEAVREMRFRIEQKTMLTASAGKEKTKLIKHCSFFYLSITSTCMHTLVHMWSVQQLNTK